MGEKQLLVAIFVSYFLKIHGFLVLRLGGSLLGPASPWVHPFFSCLCPAMIQLLFSSRFWKESLACLVFAKRGKVT
jgi:hypothetical protein